MRTDRVVRRKTSKKLKKSNRSKRSKRSKRSTPKRVSRTKRVKRSKRSLRSLRTKRTKRSRRMRGGAEPEGATLSLNIGGAEGGKRTIKVNPKDPIYSYTQKLLAQGEEDEWVGKGKNFAFFHNGTKLNLERSAEDYNLTDNSNIAIAHVLTPSELAEAEAARVAADKKVKEEAGEMSGVMPRGMPRMPVRGGAGAGHR